MFWHWWLNVLTVGSNLWINPSGEEYIADQENKNTRAKTQRDVKLLTAFLLEKNEQRKIEEIQPEELNCHVSEFIVSVKRKDGQDYEPSSLRGLFSSFNRYLKERKYSASIILWKTLRLIKQENAFTKRIYSESQMPKLC